MKAEDELKAQLKRERKAQKKAKRKEKTERTMTDEEILIFAAECNKSEDQLS